VSPEGWGVTAVAVIALVLVGHVLGRRTMAGQSAILGIIAVLAVVSYLTGGTPDEPQS